MCENRAILRRSAMGNNLESIVLDKARQVTAADEQITTSEQLEELDIEEQLIEEVSRREILFNYNLPIVQRNRMAIAEQWNEISMALNSMALIDCYQN
ncbi:bicarbonate transporter [Lasius niger]|uniref:Bicarbonate transporter n=1 Tax=Lasius niger TaxID=67767 RepID=A0A0J7KPT6_LASNI|nr:bicarbonate transporter [Lasius niger]KMQ92530.1 bicarbonate transporter [Lasius niger]